MWYARAKIKGKEVQMHRFLTNDEYEQVDHINGDGLMNIEENLRDGGGSINQRNKTVAKGVHYIEYSKCYSAQYVEYDGKRINERFYVRNYASAEDAVGKEGARIAAEAWYQTNAERIREQITQNGPCPQKRQLTARVSNSGEEHITDCPDRNGFLVRIQRAVKIHSTRISYQGRSKEEALQEAVVWRDAVLAANPSKPQGGKKKRKTE